MPISIMGSKSLVLLDWGSDQSDSATRKKEEGIQVFVPFPFTRLNTLRLNQTTLKATITHNNFRHCCVSFSPFVRQPFSKQLYTVYTIDGYVLS